MPSATNNYFTTINTDSNNVLSLTNITKTFAKKTVLEEVTLSVVRDDKIVIVGENGTGKSTLLKILIQQLKPDEGRVVLNGTVGYLSQDLTSLHSQTVVECLSHVADHEELLAFLHDPDGPKLDSHNEEWMHEFTAAGGYEFLPLLSQLGLGDLDLGRAYETLSGGEKTKVALAALAVKQPDLLLLDEPTNHLDLQALSWLERFLKSYDGAWVVISHDRTLINNSQVQHIVELTPDTHQLVRFKGDYNDYLLAKDQQYIREKLAREQTERSLHHLSTKVDTLHTSSQQRYQFRTDQDKASFNHNVQCKQKSHGGKINQLQGKISILHNQINELPIARQKISMVFSDSRRVIEDELVIQVGDVSFQYGERSILQHISFNVRNKERVVITGTNGVGKSTLLKLMVGVLQPNDGTIKLTAGASIGYLDQEQESIAPEMTPIQYCVGVETGHQVIGQLRKLGLFVDASQKLSNLSVGRQRKVQLANILLTKPNILLLDEPTNHIDLQSVEEIEAQLLAFPGAIVAISHDRCFIAKVATRVVSLEALAKAGRSSSP